MQSWLFLFIAIVAEVIATSFLKASAGFTKLAPSLLVISGYALSFYFLALTLKTLPVAIAYALWSGVGILLITLVGWFFLQQKLNLATLIGIGFIVFGVVIINLFAKVTA